MEIIFVRTTKENLLYREKNDVKMNRGCVNGL